MHCLPFMFLYIGRIQGRPYMSNAIVTVNVLLDKEDQLRKRSIEAQEIWGRCRVF